MTRAAILEQSNYINARNIGILQVLKSKESFFSLFANAVGFYVFEFFGGFLAFHMKEKYLLMCFLIPFLNKRKTWSAKAQFIISFFLSSLGLSLAGPSKLLGLDDSNLIVVLLGFFIVGVAAPFVFVPTIPETIAGV